MPPIERRAGRPSVLLVEDHADSRQMYAEFLRLDFDVHEAADGLIALEMLAQTRPDVVVTDLALPRMDGFELVERIRSDPATATLPIVALSGYSTPEYEERARTAGCDVVLRKPCLPETLAEAVVAAASGRKDS